MIAKADTMTPEEVAHFKRQIMNQIVQAKIRIYEFPDEDVLANGETPSNKEIGKSNLLDQILATSIKTAQ